MSNRSLWYMGMASALAVPYVSMDGNVPQWMQQTRSQWLGTPAAQTALPDFLTQTASTAEGYTSDVFHSPPEAPAETPVVPLEEVVRVDIQPSWVLSRWPQVSTVVVESDLSGFRVPLITGNQPHDIVGSLTYFFDKEQRLRRIEITGTTSDERYIAGLATQLCGLKPEGTLQHGLYVQRWNREPLSALIVELAPFLSSDSTQPTRHVQLEINRSLPQCRMSQEMRNRVEVAARGL